MGPDVSVPLFNFITLIAMSSTQSPGRSVATINLIAGRETITTPPGPKDYDNIESQLKIIESEFLELKDNWRMKNLNGMRDDIGDILFTVLGLAHVMGFPADDDLRLICESQFTKFDASEESAEQTKQKYLLLGVETYQIRKQLGSAEDDNFWIVTKSAKDQIGKDGKDYPKDKWLKSVNFKEPVFDPSYQITMDTPV